MGTEVLVKSGSSRGSSYDGYFECGLREGRAKMTYDNGDFYDGYWKLGYRYPRGEFSYGNAHVTRNKKTHQEKRDHLNC